MKFKELLEMSSPLASLVKEEVSEDSSQRQPSSSKHRPYSRLPALYRRIFQVEAADA